MVDASKNDLFFHRSIQYGKCKLMSDLYGIFQKQNDFIEEINLLS